MGRRKLDLNSGSTAGGINKEQEQIIDMRGPRFHVTQKGSTKKMISK